MVAEGAYAGTALAGEIPDAGGAVSVAEEVAGDDEPAGRAGPGTGIYFAGIK